MDIKFLTYDFSVCKVVDFSKVNLESPFCFVEKTDEECSLVCMTGDVPDNCTRREDGWKGLRIEGELDFSLIGILARISTLMAENGIGIFVVSTYNTDYIFVKKDDFSRALDILSANGYGIVG